MKRLNSQMQQDGAPLELILLIRTLLAGCKEISFRVSQGALAGVLGSTLSENVQGETQKKLDVISNQILKDILKESGYVKAISSEEEDDVVPCHPDGKYLVSFDPLDGSSNTEINSLIGTIFSSFGSMPRKFLFLSGSAPDVASATRAFLASSLRSYTSHPLLHEIYPR